MRHERHKRSMKRCVIIDKLDHRRFHVNDFNLLVKILYPYRQSINKYERLLEQTTFTSSQKELLLTTAHSLTIINELYRDQDRYGRYYVTREDMSNAIYMLQNELELPKHEYLLSPDLRWFYKELHFYFYQKTFTNKDVRRKFARSRSRIYHVLTELVERNFLEIIDRSRLGLHYQIKSQNTIV